MKLNLKLLGVNTQGTLHIVRARCYGLPDDGQADDARLNIFDSAGKRPPRLRG